MHDMFKPDAVNAFVAGVDDAGLSTVASIARAVLSARTDTVAATFLDALKRAPLDAVRSVDAQLAAEQERRVDLLLADVAGAG